MGTGEADLDLRTTINGLELTLETLGEVSKLLKQLDEKLAALSPEFPQVGALAGNSQDGTILTPGFSNLINAWEEAFTMMAARTAQLLGTSAAATPALRIETNEAKPEPVTAMAAPKLEIASNDVVEEAPVTEVVQETAVSEASAPAAVEATPGPKSSPIINNEPEPSWVSVGSSTRHRYSANAPSGKALKDGAEIGKPLKPIEMPSPESHVGPMMALKNAVVFGHGTEIKKFWPGTRDSKTNLESAVPNDAWRLLEFKDSIFCAREDGVSVLNVNELTKIGTFPGKYVGQTHTDSAWVGLFAKDGQIQVEFRDQAGKSTGEAVALGATEGEIHLASSGESAYIAFETGEVFLAEGGVAMSLTKVENGKVIGLSVDSRGLLVTSRSDQGVTLTFLDENGKVVKESAPGVRAASHGPVLLGENCYLFDDSKSELAVISLDSLKEVKRQPIEGIKSVYRMFGLQQDEGVTVAIMAKDPEGRPTDVYLQSLQSGKTTQVCHISATKGEMVFVDGHIAVASTSSLQNMVQVFGIFDKYAAKAA